MTTNPGDLSLATPTTVDAIDVAVTEDRDVVRVVVQEREPITIKVEPAGAQGPAGSTGSTGPSGNTGPQGVPGPPGGGGTFVYAQLSAAAMWTITHNLNRFPPVFTLDSAGTEVVGDIGYPDANTVTVTFQNPQGGTAYLAE